MLVDERVINKGFVALSFRDCFVITFLAMTGGIDSRFHGNDMEKVEITKKDYGNYPNEARLHGASIKESGSDKTKKSGSLAVIVIKELFYRSF